MKRGAIRLRAAREEDLPRLRALWRESFGSGQLFARLTETCFVPGQVQSSLVLLEDDVIRSMVFFLPTFWSDAQKGCAPAPCLVGLATDGARRHQKYASWLVETACDFMVEKGAGAVWTLLPDEGLELFFSMQGFWTLPRPKAGRWRAADLPGGASVRRAAPAEYDRVRERLLHGVNHAVAGPLVTAWQRELAEQKGGGMFLVRAGGEEGCALATADGGAVQVRELLCSAEQRPAALRALAEALGREECAAEAPLGMLRLMNRFAALERPEGYPGCGILL